MDQPNKGTGPRMGILYCTTIILHIGLVDKESGQVVLGWHLLSSIALVFMDPGVS